MKLLLSTKQEENRWNWLRRTGTGLLIWVVILSIPILIVKTISIVIYQDLLGPYYLFLALLIIIGNIIGMALKYKAIRIIVYENIINVQMGLWPKCASCFLEIPRSSILRVDPIGKIRVNLRTGKHVIEGNNKDRWRDYIFITAPNSIYTSGIAITTTEDKFIIGCPDPEEVSISLSKIYNLPKQDL